MKFNILARLKNFLPPPEKIIIGNNMPNTVERLEWITARLEILQKTLEELSSRSARYQTVQTNPVIFNQVHQNIRSEQLQLMAEWNALNDYLTDKITKTRQAEAS